MVGSFLLLDSILMYKYIRDSLSSLLERDFWVFSYDLCDTEYWKLCKFALWPDMWPVFVMLHVGLKTTSYFLMVGCVVYTYFHSLSS